MLRVSPLQLKALMEATGCLEIAGESYTDIEAAELARWHIFDVCLAGGNLTNAEFDEVHTCAALFATLLTLLYCRCRTDAKNGRRENSQQKY